MTFLRWIPILTAIVCLAIFCKNAPPETLENKVSHAVPLDKNWLKEVLRPSNIVHARLPLDTIGYAQLIDSCKYYRDTAHLDLLKDAYFTDKATQMLCAVRLYRKAYAILYNFSMYPPYSPDSTGVIYKLLGKYAKHIEGQSDSTAGRIYFIQGYLAQNKGLFFVANTYYWQSLSLLSQEKFTTDWISMLNNIAQNYNSLGDYRQSLVFSEKLLQVMAQYGQQLPAPLVEYYLSKNWRCRGWSYDALNNAPNALECYNKSLETCTELDKSDRYLFISRAYLSMSDLDHAFKYVKLALQREKTNSPDEYPSEVLQVLARCELAAGHLFTARALLWEILNHDTQNLGESHPDYYKTWYYLAKTHEKEGNLDSALLAYQAALRIFDPHLGPTENPAPHLLTADYWLVEILTDKAILLEKRFRKGGQRSDLEAALACSLLAADTKETLFDIFENDTTKTSFALVQRPLYQMGMEQAILLGDTAQAYQIALRTKAALLREKLAQDHALNAIPDTLKAHWQSLQRYVHKHRTQKDSSSIETILIAAEVKLKNIEQQIRKKAPNFTRLEQAQFNISLPEIQSKIPEKTVVLDYFWSDSLVVLFTVTAQRVQFWRINADTALNQHIKALRETTLLALTEQTCARYTQSAYECYKYLLETPLKGLNQGSLPIERLWIVPDDVLHYLPFDALLTQPKGQCLGSDTPYLLRQYAIGYAFTAAQFFMKNEAHTVSENYVGWGIQYDSASLKLVNQSIALHQRGYGYLPKARQEIETVCANMGGEKYLDGGAHKSSFLARIEHCGFAHLAMHAITDPHNPGASKLVFSPQSSSAALQEQLLTVQEILGLSLHSHLVVLSACNTANGIFLPGEGVSSLGRAFQFAGAESVLMTQWNAEDNASADIIPAFFAHLKTGKSKDIALQQAKLAMLNDPSFVGFRDPLFWAGFVVSGSMEPIKSSHTAWWAWAMGAFIFVFGFYLLESLKLSRR